MPRVCSAGCDTHQESSCCVLLYILHSMQYFIPETTASGVMVPPGEKHTAKTQSSMLGAHTLKCT